jgi:small ligand-binding sensory domain FIST
MTPRAAARTFVGEYSEASVVDFAESLRNELGTNASLGFLFVTQEWRPYLEETLELVRLHGHVSHVAGCSGSGVIGCRKEVEQRPGMSALLLSLPAESFSVFEITESAAESSAGPESWHGFTGLTPKDLTSWIVLANPYFTRAEDWLAEWSMAYPGIPTIGGLASARNSETFLLRDGAISQTAALAIALKEGLVMYPLVSQGCRPIGDAVPITKVEDNLILEIGNLPAYQALEAAFFSIPAQERLAVQNNLFLGLAATEYVEDFRQGDFLIRNILGADPKVGAIAVGAYPRGGQTVQFQLRDFRSAHQDLVAVAQRAKNEASNAFGVLLFSCAGRGKGLFGVTDHDAMILADAFGDMPLAGVFCNGEIGPVGGKPFLHGYTASAAVLCAR